MEGAGNFWMVLFLLAAGHGAFMAVALLTKSKSNPANLYLAILIAAFSISIIYYVAFWTGLHKTISPLWGLILTLPTLYGVLMYGFILRLSGRHCPPWHYLPFLIHAVYMTGFYGQQIGWWHSKFLHISAPIALIVGQNLLLIIYAFVSFRQTTLTVEKYRPRLRLMVWFFLGFVISYVSYYLLVLTINFHPIHDYAITVSMCCFMFLLGYWSFNSNLMQAGSKTGAYLKSGFSTSMASHYRERLVKVMNDEKPFTNGDLRLPQLAARLNMSPHNLSEMVNREFGVNFSEFLSSYRIREARQIMSNEKTRKLRLIDVAYQAGFNNKTSFCQTFKKQTGLTPSEFRTRVKQDLAP